MTKNNSTDFTQPTDTEPQSVPAAWLNVARSRARAVPGALAVLVGICAISYAWFEQYAVDAETTLLPWLMNRGWHLYTDLIDQHPPLLPWLLMPFDGDPGPPLRLFIVALRAVTLLLTYIVARRLCGPWASLFALTGAALWAIGANAAHLWYDAALAPLYLGILWLLVISVDKQPAGTITQDPNGVRTALALGLLMAAALLVKQHALIALPGVLFALICAGPGRWRRLTGFGLGMLVPLTLVCLYFARQGALASAAYWIIAYSLAGNYAADAAMVPPTGDTWWLILAYTPALAQLTVAITRDIKAFAGRHAALLIAGAGLLLAATLPVWPRYGRFHLEAAIPLLAIVMASTVVRLRKALFQIDRRARVLSCVSALLVAGYFLAGTTEALKSFAIQSNLSPVAAPYEGTATPLAIWVDSHTAQDAPIVLYGVDALLYRVLGHPPPRPWVPQLTWILSADHAEERWWAGVTNERPSVALVSDTWWDSGTAASSEPSPGWLRANYHADSRFPLVPYSGASPTTIVALLRDDSGR